jgi:hypothetical protein
MPVDGAEYLLAHFDELGRASGNGFGLVPMTWAEIAAYGQINRLSPFECTTLRRMSEAYCDGFAVGENPLGIPPWEKDLDD